MQIRLGIAPDSWGAWYPEDDWQTPWQRCLDEMKQSGYEGVELGPWGYFPTDADILNEELEKRELQLIAGTISGNYADNESTDRMLLILKDMVELLKRFPSAKYMVLQVDMYLDRRTGKPLMPSEIKEEQWPVVFRNIQRAADYVRVFSMNQLIPVLHPFMFSYIWTEEQIKRVMEHTDIAICLDLAHHICGGGNPVAFYKKYSGRIPYLHITECNPDVKAKMDRNSWNFAQAVQEGIMCEPGQGQTDFSDLFHTMKERGFDGWVTVEQDLYPIRNFDLPLETAMRTRKYLRKIGV